MNIKNREKLLQDIADGLARPVSGVPDPKGALDYRLGDLTVCFNVEGTTIIKLGVAQALDYLANDVYWNEHADWSDADSASVSVE